MKKRMLLSTSLCYLIATAAMAAEAPVSSLQPTLTGKMSSVSSVSDNNSVAKVTGPNTYTVEELYKNSAELNKKKVVVHGLAVKVTSGIMGKTWTHIQDGTGDKNKGTNDLICISAAYGTEVGKVVTITGTVIFKPGSRYKLVIEDATINK
jgi:hypothetical protein